MTVGRLTLMSYETSCAHGRLHFIWSRHVVGACTGRRQVTWANRDRARLEAILAAGGVLALAAATLSRWPRPSSS